MLTKTEDKIDRLNISMQQKEIADFLGISLETVKTHMKHIKVKRKLNKDKELAAFRLCQILGKNYEDIKSQIIASCICLIFIFNLSIETNVTDKRRFRFRLRNEEIESVEFYTTI